MNWLIAEYFPQFNYAQAKYGLVLGLGIQKSRKDGTIKVEVSTIMQGKALQ